MKLSRANLFWKGKCLTTCMFNWFTHHLQKKLKTHFLNSAIKSIYIFIVLLHLLLFSVLRRCKGRPIITVMTHDADDDAQCLPTVNQRAKTAFVAEKYTAYFCQNHARAVFLRIGISRSFISPAENRSIDAELLSFLCRILQISLYIDQSQLVSDVCCGAEKCTWAAKWINHFVEWASLMRIWSPQK